MKKNRSLITILFYSILLDTTHAYANLYGLQASLYSLSARLQPKKVSKMEQNFQIVVDHIKTLYPNKAKQIVIVLLASGDLNYEFELIRLFVNNGYRNLVVHAIDPVYSQGFNSTEIVNFRNKCATELALNVQEVQETQLETNNILKLGVFEWAGDFVDYINHKQSLKGHVYITYSPSGGWAEALSTKTEKKSIANNLDMLKLRNFNLYRYNCIQFYQAPTITLFLPYSQKIAIIRSSEKESNPITQQILNEAEKYLGQMGMAQSIFAKNLVIKFMPKFSKIAFGTNFQLLLLDLMLSTADDPETVIGYGGFHAIDDPQGHHIFTNVTSKPLVDYFRNSEYAFLIE